MEYFAVFVLLLSLVALFVGLVFMISKSSRGLGNRLSSYSVLTAVIAFIVIANTADLTPYQTNTSHVLNEGLLNAADRRAAERAGMTAEEWNAGRAAREAQSTEIQRRIEEHQATQRDCTSQQARILAYNIAQDFVSRSLKAPSTAEFPSSFRVIDQIRSLPNCQFEIRAWVDSQNSFGAMVRSDFFALVKRDGNRWRLVSLNI